MREQHGTDQVTRRSVEYWQYPRLTERSSAFFDLQADIGNEIKICCRTLEI
jgi:hypothetical protein